MDRADCKIEMNRAECTCELCGESFMETDKDKLWSDECRPGLAFRETQNFSRGAAANMGWYDTGKKAFLL